MASGQSKLATAQFNRRDLLTASVAATTAAAVSNLPLPAEAATETPVMRQFREWEAAKQHEESCDAAYGTADFSEAAADAAADARYGIELRMLSLPSANATDVLAKIAAWTAFGLFEFEPADDRLAQTWDELRAFLTA